MADGVNEVFCLITTLLAPERASALELAHNYAETWSVEVLFKLVKVDPRTSGGVLHLLITRAAVIAGVDSARISFPPVLDAV